MAEPSSSSASASASTSSSAQHELRKRGQVLGVIQEKAQEVFQEDFMKGRALVTSAARSRAFMYPVKGIFYFLSNRALWKPLLSRLAPFLGLSLVVTTALFAITYVPQVAILLLFNGPLAVFTTVVLILNEAAFLTNMIARNWLMQEAILDTFDGTLVSKDSTSILSEGREIKPGRDPMERLGRIRLSNPLEGFSTKAIVRYVMYLPLNFIPVVGTLVFVLLQARGSGRNSHVRYFQLKKWTPAQRSEWCEKHSGPYTAFGLTATFLEMIPVVSIFFAFTNTVGAALWAADIEAKDTNMTGTNATDGAAPRPVGQARKAE